MSRPTDERQPLLHNESTRSHLDTPEDGRGLEDNFVVRFEDDDPQNPRNWPYRRKLVNVIVIASMAILSPLASASFTPAISSIADDLNVDISSVIGATTGFVITLGIGPLILAPLSETFGRRVIYLVCFSIFTLLQIPTALSPNMETLLTTRALAGFFGSVGIANGGGTISDMFHPESRASIFGVYLLGPILGPALGPLMGGLIVQFESWRVIFWATAALSAIVTISGFFFLKESYAPSILSKRKARLEKSSPSEGPYTYEGEDSRPLRRKILANLWRPIAILTTQPIVMAMASYQAILWSCNYSLLTQFEQIWSRDPYNFESYQIGLMYLPLGFGFLIGAWFIIPKIDTIYNMLTKKHSGKSLPEYRLPLANLGAILSPICLFIFAWAVEFKLHWTVVLVLVPFGLGQVTLFNCTQNYYIDAFEKYAASAIAAGSLFRSLIGGVVPVLMPMLVDTAGYGWAISIFGFASVALAPSPLVFYYYGPALRQKFKIDL